jgi:hypothetical protein
MSVIDVRVRIKVQNRSDSVIAYYNSRAIEEVSGGSRVYTFHLETVNKFLNALMDGCGDLECSSTGYECGPFLLLV